MLHDPADQSLLAPAPAYERDNIAGSPRPASPISIASTITAVGDTSANTSTTSFATFKARDVPSNDDWRPKIKNSKHIFQWWPEILAAATSIISFIAMIIVLGWIDGTKLDQWRMFWKIQPSAVISVLITLCQMSLTPVIAEALSQLKWTYFEQRPQRLSDFEIFDEASRGPWGSVRLAYRLKWRASVASGGALLAVLALGMGPFTQQVLYTQVQHTQMTNISANIDASPFYNSGSMAAAVGVADAQADQVVSPHNNSQSTTLTLATSTFSTSTLITSTSSTSTFSILAFSTSTLVTATSYTSTLIPSTTVPSSSAPSTSDGSTSLTATDGSSSFSTSTPNPSSPTPSTLAESTFVTSQAFSALALSTSTSSEFASSTARLVTLSENSRTASESAISSDLTSSTTSPSTSIPSSSLSSVSLLETTILSSPTVSNSVSSTTTSSSPISTSVIVPSTSTFITSMFSSSTRSNSVPSISSTVTSASSSSGSTESYSIPTPQGYVQAPGYGGGAAATAGGVTAPPYPSKLRRREGNNENAQPGNTACADSWMVQATYAGLFASSTDDTFSCPTGNCTYPVFTSLGICGHCDDLTDLVTRHCTGAADMGQICTFTLTDEENAKGEGIVFTANSTCGTRSRSGTAWQSRVMNLTQAESPDILSFHSLRLPTTYSGQAECEIARPVIRKCSLSWCAKTYSNSHVVNGQLKTQSILETPLVAATSQSSSCPGIESIAPPASAESVPWRRFVRQDRPCQSIGPDDVFWVNSNDHATTRNMFTAILKDQEYAPGNPNITMAFSQMATLQAFVENNDGDLGKTIANISTSMTNLVRSAMPAQRTVQGIPSTTAIVYKVGWWWLLYPLSIIILAITFFIATIMLSGERSRIIWKSSSLAVLSHGLDGFDSTELESHNLKGMSKEAKGLKARLQMNEEGKLKLVRCGP